MCDNTDYWKINKVPHDMFPTNKIRNYFYNLFFSGIVKYISNIIWTYFKRWYSGWFRFVLLYFLISRSTTDSSLRVEDFKEEAQEEALKYVWQVLKYFIMFSVHIIRNINVIEKFLFVWAIKWLKYANNTCIDMPKQHVTYECTLQLHE